MFVVTVDQQGSRTRGDRVPELLAALPADGPVRGFERSVGDEVQAVYADAVGVLDVALHVHRLGGWSVGIGAATVDEPLPTSPRAGSGPAFVLAREAVEAAKSRMRSVPLAVRGADATAAADAEAVLVLVAALRERRTPAGWAVVDALAAARAGGDTEVRQEDLAVWLGISQQAVSQRLRTALWAEERAARGAAARLLASAQGLGEDRPAG